MSSLGRDSTSSCRRLRFLLRVESADSSMDKARWALSIASWMLVLKASFFPKVELRGPRRGGDSRDRDAIRFSSEVIEVVFYCLSVGA